MLTTPPPYVPFVIGWLRAGHDSDVSVAAATSLSLPLPHTFIISPPDQMHPSTHRPHQLLFYFHHCPDMMVERATAAAAARPARSL
ncbi:hypothetical protein Tco_1553489 [Tanacetum coccineum]